MRVLNLWASGVRRHTSPKRQFVGEALFALLLTLCLLVALGSWLSWRTQQAQLVNALLQSELTRTQSIVPAKGDDAAQLRQQKWRAGRVGQLDWLVVLAESTGTDVLFTSAKQTATGLELTGRAQSTEAARFALDKFVGKLPRYHPFKITQLSQSNTATTKPWSFEAQIDLNPNAATATVTPQETP